MNEQPKRWCEHMHRDPSGTWVFTDFAENHRIPGHWTVCPICGKPSPEPTAEESLATLKLRARRWKAEAKNLWTQRDVLRRVEGDAIKVIVNLRNENAELRKALAPKVSKEPFGSLAHPIGSASQSEPPRVSKEPARPCSLCVPIHGFEDPDCPLCHGTGFRQQPPTPADAKEPECTK